MDIKEIEKFEQEAKCPQCGKGGMMVGHRSTIQFNEKGPVENEYKTNIQASVSVAKCFNCHSFNLIGSKAAETSEDFFNKFFRLTKCKFISAML